MNLMILVVVYNLENLMTSRDFRIIGTVANVNFVNLIAGYGGCKGNAIGLKRTLEDRLE